MGTVLIRPLAREDLFDIYSYVALESEEIADALLLQFDEKFQLLAEQPHMGRERTELSMKGLRSFPLKRYLIFYLPMEGGVEIVRLLHGRQDLARELG